MRLDLSTDCLHISRSESVSELNSDVGMGHSLTPLKSRTSYVKDIDGTPPKPFGGLGRFILLFSNIILTVNITYISIKIRNHVEYQLNFKHIGYVCESAKIVVRGRKRTLCAKVFVTCLMFFVSRR